jgi:NADH:ubiquinone oxidoreductase subunit B-like Fe-S oxidoreductase
MGLADFYRQHCPYRREAYPDNIITLKGGLQVQSKEQKRKDGEERNKQWQEMSTADKIASLKGRRGKSKRQMKKLEESK